MRALEPGDPHRIGRFRVLARIGGGGAAAVYLGRSPGGKTVAVKVLHAEFAARPEARARFLAEVAATARAANAYGASVVDVDVDADPPWLATHYLPSVSLREAVAGSGALPPGAVRRLAAGLAAALASVHAAGIAHLDVTPANVLLTGGGPRLIDFGLARTIGTGEEGTSGTPGFQSPEQAAGRAAGPASDVYSLGATLAFAVTGLRPGAAQAAALAELGDTALGELIRRCLADDPGARPAVGELAGELKAAAGAEPEIFARAWPSSVASAIERAGIDAENPPAAPPRIGAVVLSERARRRLLAAASVVVLVGAGVPIGAANSGPGTATMQAPGSSAPAPPSSGSPSEEPRTIEFEFEGDVVLTSLTYTVNDEATTLEDVELPWSTIVETPPWPKRSTWKIDFEFTPGEVSWWVFADGTLHASGTAGATGQNGEDEADGRV